MTRAPALASPGFKNRPLHSDGLAIARQTTTLHRRFQGHTTHANRDLVSFGVSAIGHVGSLYVQNHHKVLKGYDEAIARGSLPSQSGAALDADDSIRSDVIQQVMCHGRIDIRSLESRHDIDFTHYFAREIQRLCTLEQDGLIDRTDAEITLTPVGRLLIRVVAVTFDAYLKPAVPSRDMSRLV